MGNEVIDILEEKGQISTSEIASRINKNFYDALRILEQLETEKKIVRVLFKNFTYWKLNKEAQNGKKI